MDAQVGVRCQSGLRESFLISSCGVGGAPSCHGIAITWCAADTPCGGNGERACCLGEGDACDSGLDQTNFLLSEGQCNNLNGILNCGGCSLGVCFQPTPCGGLGERACCLFEDVSIGACESGSIQAGNCGTGVECWCDGGFAQSDGLCQEPDCWTPCGSDWD